MATIDPSPSLHHLPLSPETIAQLHKFHYAIVDNFLTLDFADNLLQDAQFLYTKGNVTQHYFSFGGELLKKPNVYELDLSGDVSSMLLGSWSNVLANVGPEFLKRMDELDGGADVSETTCRRLCLDMESAPEIKLQINSGGGSFPWHYDNVSIEGAAYYVVFPYR